MYKDGTLNQGQKRRAEEGPSTLFERCCGFLIRGLELVPERSFFQHIQMSFVLCLIVVRTHVLYFVFRCFYTYIVRIKISPYLFPVHTFSHW